MTTGAWSAWGEWLRRPVDRIAFAGAEYASHFVGQMEGAIRSAEASVEWALGKLEVDNG